MKNNLVPVIFTAMLTSAFTLFVAGKFQQSPTTSIGLGSSNATHGIASFASNSPASGASVPNFEVAADASVRSIVHIKTTTNARTIISNDVNDVFSQLFGPRQYQIPSQVESGSGVIISQDGYIVTNNHVVANGDDITVTFNDKITKKAHLISADPSTDIALLKVDQTNLPYLEFGNSDDVKLGQWVLAAGFPLSLDATVTAGIVSAKGRTLGVNSRQSSSPIESFIQTDAAVNPGNSGGALVNTQGQLIGINSAIASPTGSYAGYSYAIPSNIVRKVVNDMLKYGSVQRAYLGISFLDPKSATPQQIQQLGLDKIDGVYIDNVVPNSGAAVAGLTHGDIIIAINGQKVNDKPHLQEQIAIYQPGDNITVTYKRNGTEYKATVKLTNINGTTDILKAEQPLKMLGASFKQMTQSEKESYNVKGGIIVTDPGNGTLARQTNMKKGFIILSINNQPVSTLADFSQLMASSSNLQIAGFQPGYDGMYYFELNNIDAQHDK